MTEWLIYLRDYDGREEDVRAGTVAATMANFNGWSKPKRMATPKDFFPRLAAFVSRPSADEQIAQMKADTIARGGKVE